MFRLISLLIFTSFPLICLAGDKEEYGSIAGKFLGYCQGSQYLKKDYCPNISQMNLQECLDLATNQLPVRYREEFRSGMEKLVSEQIMIQQSRGAIESNYLVTLKNYNGDSNTACKVWHGLVLQEQMDSIQRLKDIARNMK